jgi:hypothetical protein
MNRENPSRGHSASPQKQTLPLAGAHEFLPAAERIVMITDQACGHGRRFRFQLEEKFIQVVLAHALEFESKAKIHNGRRDEMVSPVVARNCLIGGPLSMTKLPGIKLHRVERKRC